MNPITVAFLGVFLGVLSRTVLPYLRKRKEAREGGKELAFDIQYVQTALYSLVVSGIVTALIFPSYAVPSVPMPYVFCSSFAFGYSANDLVNEVMA